MGSSAGVSPASAMEEWRSGRRGEHHRSGGGRFRAEIEMDRGLASIPRSPELGFAAAVREPLVRLQRPKYDFERWDWEYFAWPHDRPDANLDMRDSDPRATFEADRKASESFLIRTATQLEACKAMPGRSTPPPPQLGAPDTPKQEEINGFAPPGYGAPWHPDTPKQEEIDSFAPPGYGAPLHRRHGCAKLSPMKLVAVQGPCAY